MSIRFAIAAATMMALAAVVATTVGCSADDCTKASEHFSQCIGMSDTTDTTTTTASSASPLRCDGEYLCSSQCVNSSDCPTLTAAFNGDPTKGARFLGCQAKCASGK